jgi:adenylosuccinate lyase
MPEREARNVAAQLARKAGIEGRRFHDVLLEDGRVKQFLTPDEIRKYSDPAHYVGESGRIIEQAHEELFGKRILPKSLSIHSSLAPSR